MDFRHKHPRNEHDTTLFHDPNMVSNTDKTRRTPYSSLFKQYEHEKHSIQQSS